MPKLFIATPTSGDDVKSAYCRSLVRLTQRLAAAGIDADYLPHEGPNVALQRDYLAHRFLGSNASHMLMVDDDMSFAVDIPERYLAADKEFVAAICPKRLHNHDRARQASERGATYDDALLLSHAYNVELPPGLLKIEDGFFRVPRVGLAFALISRRCFEQIGDIPKLMNPFARKPLPSYFNEVREEGAHISEDWSFCDRVRAAGMQVWADPFAKIGHVGSHTYAAPFSNYLSALRRQTERAGAAE